MRCPRVCVCVSVRVRQRLRLHARGAAARRGAGGGGPGSGRVPRPPRPPLAAPGVDLSSCAFRRARRPRLIHRPKTKSRGRLWQLRVSPASCRRRAGKRRAASARERRVCPPPPFPPSAGALCFAFPPLSEHARLSLSAHSPVGEAAISHGAHVCVRVCVRAGPRGGARSWTRRGRERNGERERTRPARWGRRNRQTGPHPGARASGQGGRGGRPPCACVCGGPCGGRGQARFGACGTRGGCEGGRASERRARARGERERPLTPLSRCLSVPPPRPVPQTHNQALSPPQVRSQCVCVPACRQFDRRARGGRPGRPRMQA